MKWLRERIDKGDLVKALTKADFRSQLNFADQMKIPGVEEIVE
jgi:hypothetical protein